MSTLLQSRCCQRSPSLLRRATLAYLAFLPSKSAFVTGFLQIGHCFGRGATLCCTRRIALFTAASSRGSLRRRAHSRSAAGVRRGSHESVVGFSGSRRRPHAV